jgi:general secretion pathway protein I
MKQEDEPNVGIDKVLITSKSNVYLTRGFTLIEVVIAIAILGVALAVIFELFSGGLRLGRVSEEYVLAINYASLKMEELTTKGVVREGTEEGEFNKEYRWQTFVKKLDLLPIKEKGIDFKPPAELMKIKVKVLWMSGVKERSTSIESYKAVKLEENEEKK